MRSKKLGKTACWDLLCAILLAVCAYFLTMQRTGIDSYALSPRRMLLLLVMVNAPLWAFKRNESSLVRCIAILSPAFMILFFSMPPIITYDTAHYLNYLPILNGEIGYENWDIVRGPVFPAMISAVCKLFGHSVWGILSIQYLVMMASLFCIVYMMKHAGKKEETGLGLMILTALFFFLNPLVQGGYHTLLTEFVAAFVALISCLISWKWIFVTGKITLKDMGYALYYLFASVFMWQLKQPWMGCVLYPLIVVIFCSFINRSMRAKFRALFRLVVLAICVASMLVSTMLWDSYISSFGELDETRTSEGLAAENLVKTLPIQFVEELDAAQAAQRYPTTEHLEEGTRYSVYQLNTLRDGALPRYMFVKADAQGGVLSSVKLLLKCWGTFPKEVVEQYAINYLKICNILAPDPERSNRPSLQLQKGSGDENLAIYYRLLNYNENAFWVAEYLEEAKKPFIANYACADRWKSVLIMLRGFADWLFKGLTASTIIVWSFLFLRIIQIRKRLEEHSSWVMHFVLWSFCLANLLFHTMLGATIDRYVFPNYVLECLSLAMLLTRIGAGIYQKRFAEKGREALAR